MERTKPEFLVSLRHRPVRNRTFIRFVVALVLTLVSLPLLAEDKLVLTITPPAQPIHVGDYPRFDVTISNRGSNSVTLVTPGDGSEDAWRTPVVGWSMLPADTTQKHPETPSRGIVARCGNINGIKLSEVFALKPGEDKHLEHWIGWLAFQTPGKFRIVFYYQNVPDMKIQGVPLEEHEKGAIKRIRRSTPCKLVSNEVVIEVLP
jgi:hypothetical protein